MSGENGKLLTAADILACKGRRYASASIPGYGKIRIQSMTGEEWSRWRRSQLMGESPGLSVALCVVNEHGEREFSDAQADSVAETDSELFVAMEAAIQQHIGNKMELPDLVIEEAKKN